MSIVNLGNTCYLGAALQCLMSTNRFVSRYTHSLKKTNKWKSFTNVCKQIEHGHRNIDPSELYSEIKSKYTLFDNNNENDAHEALQVILDLLACECISNLFKVRLRSVVSCVDCAHVVESDQYEYGIIDIGLCEHETKLDGYRCDGCGGRNCRVNVRITHLPHCLIVKSSNCKNLCLTLHGKVYGLRAVCKYLRRDEKGGHYVTVVRKNDACWYLKDDQKSVLLFKEGVDNLDPLFVDACFFVFEIR